MVKQEAGISKSFERGRRKKLLTMKTAKKTTPHSYRVLRIIFGSIVDIIPGKNRALSERNKMSCCPHQFAQKSKFILFTETCHDSLGLQMPAR